MILTEMFSALFVGSMNPLCVLQLDDPPQRFNTSVLKNTTNPAWDQPFILYVLLWCTANHHCCWDCFFCLHSQPISVFSCFSWIIFYFSVSPVNWMDDQKSSIFSYWMMENLKRVRKTLEIAGYLLIFVFYSSCDCPMFWCYQTKWNVFSLFQIPY